MHQRCLLLRQQYSAGKLVRALTAFLGLLLASQCLKDQSELLLEELLQTDYFYVLLPATGPRVSSGLQVTEYLFSLKK